MGLTDLERAKADLLAPMRQLHRTAEAEVTRLKAELDEAKKTKREIEQLLRGVDPEFPNPYAGNGKRKSPGSGTRSHKYGPEKIQVFTAWLHSNAEQLNAMNEDQGFYASGLSDLEPPVVAQSGLSAIFSQLHEDGILRLNKSGGLGGRKYYKVVA